MHTCSSLADKVNKYFDVTHKICSRYQKFLLECSNALTVYILFQTYPPTYACMQGDGQNIHSV